MWFLHPHSTFNTKKFIDQIKIMALMLKTHSPLNCDHTLFFLSKMKPYIIRGLKIQQGQIGHSMNKKKLL